ncbi:MAG TPA: carbohydrate kinase family protein [Candidatus Acidoferrales bacterium]|nr:carbohydrate kinase family protein [Candidatus Acidoferrales bacterium]
MTAFEMGNILVLGDINVDVLGRLPAPLRVGGDATSPALEIHLGGVGANTTLALARWKTPVRLLGSAGRDWFGDFALQTLAREGVDVSQVQRPERTATGTGLMFIAVEPDGQRTIFGSRGANTEITLPADSNGYWDGVVGLHLVGYSLLSSSGTDAVRRLLAEAGKRGAWTSLDVGDAPSRQVPQAILQVARELDILIAAFDEASALTGQRDVRGVFGALEQAGARQVVVKCGANGCWLRERGELLNAPAFSLQCTDTTGAGDAFTAALLRARHNGWPWPEAAVLANAAGALTAAVVGAGEQVPALNEIVSLLQTSRLPGEADSWRTRALELLTQELSRQGSVATA